ncbi:MAG: FlgD immunoglobulin-like domain containing protein [Candidatus Kapaibacteriota bacterium]
MKFLLTCIVVFVLPNFIFAQNVDTSIVSLSIGNKYYWFWGVFEGRNNQTVDPRMNLYFYEEIRKDTIIQGKRYAVIFNSLNNQQRYERAEQRNLYEWVNGQERKKMSLDVRRNDTVFNLMAASPRVVLFGNYTIILVTQAHIHIDSPNISFTSNDSSYVMRSMRDSNVIGIFSRKFGLRESAETYINGLRVGIFLHAARIDGRLYGDTLFGLRTSVAQNGTTVSSLAAPNPFSEQMQYAFQLYAAASVSVAVINTENGKIIRSLPAQELANGKHTYTWDGKDDNGRAAPAGAYIVQVYANNKPLATAKVIKQ